MQDKLLALPLNVYTYRDWKNETFLGTEKCGAVFLLGKEYSGYFVYIKRIFERNLNSAGPTHPKNGETMLA